MKIFCTWNNPKVLYVEKSRIARFLQRKSRKYSTWSYCAERNYSKEKPSGLFYQPLPESFSPSAICETEIPSMAGARPVETSRRTAGSR